MDFNLQEECQGLVEVGSYSIPGEIDVSSLDSGSVDSTLEGESSAESGMGLWLLTMSSSKDAIEALANSSENITDLKVFDVYRSYLKCAKLVLLPTPNSYLFNQTFG
jgi:hypothetical protein